MFQILDYLSITIKNLPRILLISIISSLLISLGLMIIGVPSKLNGLFFIIVFIIMVQYLIKKECINKPNISKELDLIQLRNKYCKILKDVQIAEIKAANAQKKLDQAMHDL